VRKRGSIFERFLQKKKKQKMLMFKANKYADHAAKVGGGFVC
jgi:hypothetical protein